MRVCQMRKSRLQCFFKSFRCDWSRDAKVKSTKKLCILRMISMKKVLRVRMIFIKRSYKFFERLQWTKSKYFVFEWTSSQWTKNKYFVFEWVSSQRKITDSLEDFWQRETNSSNDFVLALDCASNVIDDEYNIIVVLIMREFFSLIEEWLRRKHIHESDVK